MTYNVFKVHQGELRVMETIATGVATWLEAETIGGNLGFSNYVVTKLSAEEYFSPEAISERIDASLQAGAQQAQLPELFRR